MAAQYLTFSFAQTETLHRNTNVHVLCIHNDREVLRHNGSQARQWLRQDMKCWPSVQGQRPHDRKSAVLKPNGLVASNTLYVATLEITRLLAEETDFWRSLV